MLHENGILDIEEEDLIANLQNMLEDYEKLDSDNSALNDSIEIEKGKITILLEELQNKDKQLKRTTYDLYKYKKEANVLRDINKHYVHTIDSINTLYLGAQADLKMTQGELDQVSTERDDFKNQANSLIGQVEQAKMLTASQLTAVGIRIRSSGKQEETTRAKRADMVKACFTVNENRVADKGEKEVFIRVSDPSGKILTNAKSKTIEGKNGQIQMSESRKIDYQNSASDVCIYFEKSADMVKGTYQVEIYCEGYLLKKTTFALK